MKVVLSVGGSILAPSGGHEQVAAYAEAIQELVAAGCTVGVVVGGGAIAREYIENGRALGANEIELDGIGIAVTRLNARLLIAALGDSVHPTPAETYEEARTHLGTRDVCIMGGSSPGHTTDAVSAALAEYIDAELLVLATSVQGVFDADPNVHADATKFDQLSPQELVDAIADLEMNAGSSAPVDLLAAKLIDRSDMRSIVLDGNDASNVTRAVRTGAHNGTAVTPAVASTPSLWPDA